MNNILNKEPDSRIEKILLSIASGDKRYIESVTPGSDIERILKYIAENPKAAGNLTQEQLELINSIPGFKSQLEEMKLDLKDVKPDISSVLNLNKLNKVNRFGHKCISIIGDSISHGFNSTDHYLNSWVGILKQMINVQLDSTNKGFYTIQDFGYDTNFAIIGRTNWGNTTDYSGVLGRRAMTSSILDATLTFTLRKPTDNFSVCYTQTPNGGVMDVEVNGQVRGVINTAGVEELSKSSIPIKVGAQDFPLTITIRKKDTKATTVSGMWYFDDISKPMVNNYSITGTKLALYPKIALDYMCDSNFIILALGHNDDGIVENYDEFTSNINYIRDKCIASNIGLLVLDFVWTKKISDSFIKQELKRLNQEVPWSSYYDIFPYLYEQSTLGINQAKLDGLWADGSHPLDKGHQIISEFVATVLGLSITSKERLYKNHSDWQYIGVNGEIQFSKGSNVYERCDLCSKIKKSGNMVNLYLYMNTSDLVDGDIVLQLPTEYIPQINVNAYGQIKYNGTTTKIQKCLVDTAGRVKVYDASIQAQLTIVIAYPTFK